MMRLPSALSRGTIALAVVAAAYGCEVVSVTAVDVMLVALSPAADTIYPGETVRLRVKLEDSEGNALSERPVEWSTADGAVAAVDSTGLVQAGEIGTTVVRAESGRARGEATITVRRRPIARVTSIEYHTQGGWRSDRDLRVTVWVVDQDGEPVPNAGVGIEITKGETGHRWFRPGATDEEGRAIMSLNRHSDGCYTTRIVGVTAPELPWDEETPENGYCTK